MDNILDRARFIYASNGGAVSKEDAAKIAVNELQDKNLFYTYRLFDTNRNEYIKEIAKRI